MTRDKTTDFLDRKKAQGFGGCAKLVFEGGRLAIVQEARACSIGCSPSLNVAIPFSELALASSALGLVPNT